MTLSSRFRRQRLMRLMSRSVSRLLFRRFSSICVNPRPLFAKAVAVLTAGWLLAACSPTYDWRTIMNNDNGYTVDLPAKPSLHHLLRQFQPSAAIQQEQAIRCVIEALRTAASADIERYIQYFAVIKKKMQQVRIGISRVEPVMKRGCFRLNIVDPRQKKDNRRPELLDIVVQQYLMAIR